MRFIFPSLIRVQYLFCYTGSFHPWNLLSRSVPHPQNCCINVHYARTIIQQSHILKGQQTLASAPLHDIPCAKDGSARSLFNAPLSLPPWNPGCHKLVHDSFPSAYRFAASSVSRSAQVSRFNVNLLQPSWRFLILTSSSGRASSSIFFMVSSSSLKVSISFIRITLYYKYKRVLDSAAFDLLNRYSEYPSSESRLFYRMVCLSPWEMIIPENMLLFFNISGFSASILRKMSQQAFGASMLENLHQWAYLSYALKFRLVLRKFHSKLP